MSMIKPTENAVQSPIESFLTNSTPQVLVLKGKWGIGKTHYWHNQIIRLSKNDDFCKRKYAYVSLFGITSLDDLISKIVENVVGIEAIGIGPSIKSLYEYVIESTDENADTVKPSNPKWKTAIVSMLPKLVRLKDVGPLKEWVGAIKIFGPLVMKDTCLVPLCSGMDYC